MPGEAEPNTTSRTQGSDAAGAASELDGSAETGGAPRRPPRKPPVQNPLVSRCSLPPWALASSEFQDNPWPIEIVGVRQDEARLFLLLDRIADPQERQLARGELPVHRQ